MPACARGDLEIPGLIVTPPHRESRFALDDKLEYIFTVKRLMSEGATRQRMLAIIALRVSRLALPAFIVRSSNLNSIFDKLAACRTASFMKQINTASSTSWQLAGQ